VFARRGISRASHAEVAAEANVAVATVFAYFRTRAELVQAILAEVEEYYGVQAAHCQRSDVSAPRALLDSAEAYAVSIDTHPNHARVWLEWSTAIREEIWPLYVAFQTRMVGVFADTIRRGQREGTVPADLDAEESALMIVGAAHVVAQMKFTRRPAEKVHRFLLALLRGALGVDAVTRALR
jgi:TetR/AcrR family hemagglutinin/protease transcriptional regulator